MKVTMYAYKHNNAVAAITRPGKHIWLRVARECDENLPNGRVDDHPEFIVHGFDPMEETMRGAAWGHLALNFDDCCFAVEGVAHLVMGLLGNSEMENAR